MEFNEKLQELRKRKGMTQEEVAEALYVSRTAVSKWESGRGYPNIESLKGIAKFYGITIDELLSGDELLDLARRENEQKEKRFCDLVFGLLDLSVLLFFFLPLLGQKSGAGVQEVSLFALSSVAPYLKMGYYVMIIGIALWGVLTLALQNCEKVWWIRSKYIISLILSVAGALLFVVSLQPYGATLLLVFLIIKVLMLAKKR